MAEANKQAIIRRFGATIEYYRPADDVHDKPPVVQSNNPIILFEQRKKAKAVIT